MGLNKFSRFSVCGAGVTPRYEDSSRIENVKQWHTMTFWCESQGWERSVDFFPSGQIDGAWHFKSEENQSLFAMRWA